MLKTEQRNKNTMHIDKMATLDMVKAIQVENENAAKAVAEAVDSISSLIDGFYENMKKGGRLFYIGCGTSGRLGVLDASEIPPTYGLPYGVVVGVIAGGDKALQFATEGTEDSFELGQKDLASYNINENDCVIGISVAGGAQYVIGALTLAKEKGCKIGCITSNEDTKISKLSDYTIYTDTGAEVITGSTRMKAGTAHKMVLNMISTALMVKLGFVYENLMINLKPSNEKLAKRMVSIVCDILGCDEIESKARLEKCNWVIREALKVKF